MLQAWLRRFDLPHDVVIGIARDASGTFKAHAWLDYEKDALNGLVFRELHRMPP